MEKSIETKTENSDTRKRHGFTSFCLIFGLVVFAIIGVASFFASGATKIGYDKQSEAQLMATVAVFNGIVCIGYTIGFVLLLCWKKIGFWIIAGLSIISILIIVILAVMIPNAGSTGSIMSSGLSGIAFRLIIVAIIWGVLHIRKNGKNTWEQLKPISKFG